MPIITMPGKHFKAEDLKDNPQVLTIKDCKWENVADEGEPEEHKWCLKFEETTQDVVLNGTRLDQLVSLFDSKNSDDWRGNKITLYRDPDVRFAGKKIGGVAIKAAPGLFTKPIDA